MLAPLVSGPNSHENLVAALTQRLYAQATRDPMTHFDPSSLQDTGSEPGEALPEYLRIAIRLCVRQLDVASAAALRALAVFPPKPNTFSAAAALAVSAASAETLETLTTARLLDRVGPERYTMPRDYAAYLRLEPMDRGTSERLIAYGAALVDAHAGEDATLECELGSILAALERAHTCGAHGPVVRMATAIAPCLLACGLHDLAEVHLGRARVAAERTRDTDGLAGVDSMLERLRRVRGGMASPGMRQQQ
jgi:hypothetical protein